ncbi:REP element-mobilizing transposase RayT [Algoriphagus locisalis]|uniref:REP element-mobilizing transposase RayT n=1 Tax=Algoriphagus locisalis TaxID=305507 RepID=A0A1I7CT92_9BACT|nr:IS200/IS605 family transposase [Algoriphagus locisalis]SFU02596.1 REP element-mobilizing transposase RayT [Algoriphagus locisalis]
MAQSLSKVYLHIVFSTKRRIPYVKEEFKEAMESYLVKVGSDLGSFTESIYLNPDHLHWLCTLPRTIAIAEFLNKVKSNSSKIGKLEVSPHFAWQNGYGAFSVSQSKVETVRAYILNQHEHHRKVTFQEEFRKFLEEYRIEYDEKYVWD